ncbi:SpaA isopeptide-forming pilin-related protein [Enterococcus crotali]|uniref:SpaA isopeptide-forming pilin-related protein n=1 Tax=Enterococcus crotali TaxID=1453587 RepID=UPI00308445BA
MVNIEKNWIDNNNQLGLRPDAISVILKRTVVTSTAWQESQPILLSKPTETSDQWSFTVDSITPQNETNSVFLAAFNNKGEDFTYSATEVNTDPNYISSTDTTHDKIILTNQLNKTNLTFTKVDEEDQPLQNVRFKLLNAQGVQVGDVQTSDKNGAVTFTNLDKGSYQLVEIAPLSGYEAIAPIQLTIDQNSKGELAVTTPENWSYKVVNKKIKDAVKPKDTINPKVPETPKSSGQIPNAGEKVQSWLLLIGLIIIVVAVILYYRNKRNKKE